MNKKVLLVESDSLWEHFFKSFFPNNLTLLVARAEEEIVYYITTQRPNIVVCTTNSIAKQLVNNDKVAVWAGSQEVVAGVPFFHKTEIVQLIAWIQKN